MSVSLFIDAHSEARLDHWLPVAEAGAGETAFGASIGTGMGGGATGAGIGGTTGTGIGGARAAGVGERGAIGEDSESLFREAHSDARLDHCEAPCDGATCCGAGEVNVSGGAEPIL